MSYCINPVCPQPQNPDRTLFCQTCGFKLRLGDRYHLIRLLGQSRFTRTFLAVDTVEPEPDFSQPSSVIRQCVIRQFLPQTDGVKQQAIAQFQQEIQALKILGHHPQIPALWDAFEQDGQFYLVQEFVEGDSLAKIVQKQGSFSETQIWQILNDLLPVLQFIHQHQIIHRDIQPENIIYRSNELPVLTDFGSAKIVTTTSDFQPDQIGSPEYIAPEQTRGEAVFASDLYSLGVTCIYLLTQVSPFDLYDVTIDRWVWQDYLTPTHPSTQTISHRLIKILDKLIQNSVNLRFQSAEAVMQAIAKNPILQTCAVVKSAPAALFYPTATLIGHTDSITSVAIHPNGEILASASDDKTIGLWNIFTSQLITTLSGHTGGVSSIAFSPNGKLLASASHDKTIRIWDLTTTQILLTLRGHTAAVKSVCFAPNGQILASGSWDKTIKLWHVASGAELCTLVGHGLQVSAVAFSPDGKLLASASFDRTVRLWKLNISDFNISNLATINPQLDRTLSGHTWAVNAVAFSADGNLLATGSSDNTIRLWETNTGQLLHQLDKHSWSVVALAFSSQPLDQTIAPTLISGSWDKTLKLWQAQTGTEIATLVGNTDSVNAIAVAPINPAIVPSIDGSNPTGIGQEHLVVSGSRNKIIHLWRLKL
jgi:WD40 repeat protein